MRRAGLHPRSPATTTGPVTSNHYRTGYRGTSILDWRALAEWRQQRTAADIHRHELRTIKVAFTLHNGHPPGVLLRERACFAEFLHELVGAVDVHRCQNFGGICQN